MNNSKRSIFIIILLILAIVLLAVYLSQPPKPKVIDQGSLFNEMRADNVYAIQFEDSYNVKILLRSDLKDDAHPNGLITLDEFRAGKKASYACIGVYRDDFVKIAEGIYGETTEDAEGNVVPVRMWPIIVLQDPNANNFWPIFFQVIMIIGIVGLGIYVFLSFRKGNGAGGGGNAMNFGKTKARIATNVKIKFADVAGAEEEKTELQEIVEFLKSPKKFTTAGARIPKGVLLVGPPGTGKTLFAKAVAGEAGVPFFSLSGSDFVEMFVGVGASRVRDLFAQAKKSMPCIVFIDEIDAVGRKRGAGLGGGNDEREQTLNQLLVQMDGFEANEGIIIIAATNRADVLDPALLRPGRFDRQIYVHIPDVKGREAIFKVHARNKQLAKDIEFKLLARMTTGFSGADIENLLNEAAILAARNNRSVIIMSDVLESINKVIAGPQKKSRVVTEADKRITAYHESGHAVIGKLFKYCDAVQEVSIIPRGMAAGYTLSRPKNDDDNIAKNKLNDMIAMLLGGRACEELVIEDITTGASSDIKRATGLARSMVAEWGMSDALPNLFFGGEQEVFIGRDFQTQNTYSDKIASIIDTETKAIVDKNYARAIKALKDNMSIVNNMVKLLFERETIYADEVDLLMQGKTAEEVSAYINEKAKEQEKKNESYAPPKPAEKYIVPTIMINMPGEPGAPPTPVDAEEVIKKFSKDISDDKDDN